MESLAQKADIITAPFSVLKDWADDGMPMPEPSFKYDAGLLKTIFYEEIALDKPWTDYDIHHELTDKGIKRFAEDWNNLIG